MKTLGPNRVVRATIFCAGFFLAYWMLNRPAVIIIQRLSLTAWCPEAGLSIAETVGLGPWSGPLVLVTHPIVGRLICGTPIFSLTGLISALDPAFYSTLAGYILRGPWKIDATLRPRQDVVRQVGTTITAAVGSTCVSIAQNRPVATV